LRPAVDRQTPTRTTTRIGGKNSLIAQIDRWSSYACHARTPALSSRCYARSPPAYIAPWCARTRARSRKDEGVLDLFGLNVPSCGPRIWASPESGDAMVTWSDENRSKRAQAETGYRTGLNPCCYSTNPISYKPHKMNQKSLNRPFHGGNTGSNPVGDANKTKNLARTLEGWCLSISQLCQQSPKPLAKPTET
jgi:hypothetical protein